MSAPTVTVVAGEAIARYGFPGGHPFGADRHEHFLRELSAQGLATEVNWSAPRIATDAELASFHTPTYIDFVRERSVLGKGYLDGGDTPAFPGVFEAAAHHAARARAAGFCVFSDCGVAVEQLRRHYGIRRVAYVDIDAHHGDGVFYAFEEDAELRFADIHEDGRYLYPGTGAREETGRGAAAGTKLNLPMPPGSDDAAFLVAWEEVEAYLQRFPSDLILFQCGADSLAGDPITHLRFSAAAHAHAARRLCAIAESEGHGRVLGMGGGGYNPRNLAKAWTAVVSAFLAREP